MASSFVDEKSEWRRPLDDRVDFKQGTAVGEIADAMDEWEGKVAECLGLTSTDVASIKTRHKDRLDLQTRAALQLWQEKNGQYATYHKLIDAFLKAGKTSYAEAVQKVLRKPVGDSPDSNPSHGELAVLKHPTQSNSSGSQESNSGFIIFQCRCGKGCSYESFISGKCIGSSINLFPYLHADQLTASDKDKLIRKLISETKDIDEAFQNLICSTFDSLDEQNIPVDQVTSHTLTFCLRDLICNHHATLEFKSVYNVQTYLVTHRYVSFFNYRTLERIIKRFGSDRDKKNLGEYLEKFRLFCKRSVYEVPQHVVHEHAPACEEKIVVKINEKFWFAAKNQSSQSCFHLVDLYTVEDNIAEVMDIDVSRIFLLDIKKGCVELTFTVLGGGGLFPLTPSQLKRLSMSHIDVIVQPDYSFPVVLNIIKTLGEVRWKATCSQCQQLYSEQPTILPGCLHTFCLPCLATLTTNALSTSNAPSRTQSGIKSCRCPECSSLALLPENGIMGLQASPFAHKSVIAYKRFLRYYQYLPSCTHGSGNLASAFCFTCHSLLCSDCLDLHNKLSTKYESHKFGSLDKYRQSSSPSGVASNFIGDLKRKATCSLCQQLYGEEPKILPSCLHTFCLPCLSKLPTLDSHSDRGTDFGINHSRTKKIVDSSDQRLIKEEAIQCPKCLCTCPLPVNGVKGLQTSLVARESVLAYRHLENYNKASPSCEQCIVNHPACAFCYTCCSFICEDCMNWHKLSVYSKSHEVDTLEEFHQKINTDPLSILELVLRNSGNICWFHPDLELKFFCTSCEEVLCRCCVVDVHRNHPIESITIECLEEHRKRTVQSLTEIDEKHQLLDEVSITCYSRNEELVSVKNKLKESILTLLFQSEKSLKGRKEHLLSKVDEFTNPSLEALKEFKRQVETLHTQVTESRKVIDSIFTHKGPTGMLSVERTVARHISELKKRCQNIGSIPEVPKITFHKSEKKEDEIINFGEVTKGYSSSDPRLKQTSVVIGQSRYNPLFDDIPLESPSLQQLKSRGLSGLILSRHSFISLLERIFSGEKPSDINSFFTGMPVRTIDDLNCPYEITATSSITVCEIDTHQVLVLDYFGHKMLRIASKGNQDGQFCYPKQVIFTHNREMIIIDGIPRFQVFSPGGRWLRTIQIDFNPISVAIGSNKRIYVCNKVDHHIRVFNSDFTPHEVLGQRGSNNCEFQKPCGIVSDLRGYLYIADTWNHRIQVLKEDGTFVRKFGTQGSKPGQLNSPSKLCVDPSGMFLFVSESQNHRVSVFKTDNGQFVKCFGKFGKGLGELDRPYGISMDFNRLLYVCDYGNNRIQIFK